MSRPILVLTIGMSCSGKTTWADEFLEEKYYQSGEDWWDLNRDKWRFDLFTDGVRDWTKYKFNNKNEKLVSENINENAKECSEKRTNIIVTDTNLNPKIRQKWYDWAKENGYDVVTKEFIISWDEAVKRNNQREGGISTKVLRSQYERMNEYLGRKTYTPDESKPKAFIIDVDGTIADMSGIRKPYEWDKVGLDKPRTHVISMVQGMIESGILPIFLSGRDGCCVKDTYDWIMSHVMEWYLPEDGGFHLYMREAGDSRKDTIIKEELFWDHLADNYNVVSAIDDRPCVVNLWNEIGIPNVIAVADQLKEF